MDSPERNLTITAAEVQGSPLFNFLCGLSPIKPVKSVHVAPTFSELSFPPPPAVFVSPKVDARNSRDQSKSRVEVVQARSGSCRVKLQTENKQLFRNQAQKDQNLGYTEKNKDIALPCSELVEEYLAEPVEQELQTVSSAELSTVSNTCHGEARTLEPDFEDVERLDDSLTPPVMPPKFPENDGMKMRSAAGFDKERVDDAAGVLGQGTSSSKKSSSIAVHPNSEGNEKDEEIMELDRESSDFAFLLSQGTDRLPPPADIDDLQNHSSSALSALSIISTVGESIKDQGHKSGEAEMPTHVSTNSLGNKGHDVSGTCKKEAELVVEPEAGGRQQALVCRVNVQSQRVVRRRCLDFEVPEDQWKNKSSISLLKSRAVKSNTSPQSALSCDTNSKIPVLVLKERAAATSGATNSQSTQDTGTCTHVYPRTDASTSSVANVKSTLLRLSRCSSLKDKECTQAKPDSQLALVACPSGTSPVPVGMPSGIGLHLNSLTGSMSFSHSSRENHEASGSTALSKSSSALIGLAPLASMQESPSEDYGNCLIAASSGNNLQVGSASAFRQGLVVSLFEKTRTDECQVQSEHSDRVFSSKRSMTCYRSVTLGIKRMEESLPSSLLEKKPSPLGRKRVLLQDFPQQLDSNGLEDSNQSPHSPKKKRQSTSTTEKSGDGCKRCNCKKSKCLKLYCDCFAAGIYCVDSCSCQDCFNKPEFEDKVLETRQQIESRNPLAFAPKIVQAVDSSPTDGEECGDTPASARHKRGCNCKKSQCLKKYCECYQVGVGCSDGCRCENCRNVYGRKEGPDELEEKDCLVTMVDKDVGEELFDTSDNRFNSASQQQNNDLSPITPSFQYAGQDRSTVKSRSSSKRHIPSEELHSPTFLLSSAKPPKSPSRLLRSNRGSSTSASMGMQLSKIAGSPNTTPNLSRTGQFSPRWDGLGDICTLTPLPQAPLRPTPASASVLDGPAASPSTNGQPCNELSSSGDGSVRTSSKFLRGASPISQYPVSRSLLGGRPSQSPMNVQRTPMTPIFTSGSKIVHEDLDVLGHQFVGSTEDDNTPEFLKDTDFTGSPVQVFKTTSPKQKRVSPPHHQGPRETPNQPRQSPGMRSRKFVLQSIPLIPPTPVAVVHEQVNGSRSEA